MTRRDLIAAIRRTVNLSSHRLVDETIVESLFDISLLSLGMVDEFQRIRHRLLDHSERGRERFAVIFEAPLQQGIVVDSSKFPERALGHRRVVPGELLPFTERA